MRVADTAILYDAAGFVSALVNDSAKHMGVVLRDVYIPYFCFGIPAKDEFAIPYDLIGKYRYATITPVGEWGCYTVRRISGRTACRFVMEMER